MDIMSFFFLIAIMLAYALFSIRIKGKRFELHKEQLDIEKRAAPDQEFVVLVVARYVKYHQSHGCSEDADTLAHKFFVEAYREKKSSKELNEKLTETERKELEECYDNINRENLLYEVPDWLKTFALQWSGRQDEDLLHP